MGIFTDWLKKEQGIEEPVGLDAVRQRVLGENEEIAGPLIKRGTNPQREGQPDLNQIIRDVRGSQSSQKPPETPAPKTDSIANRRRVVQGLSRDYDAGDRETMITRVGDFIQTHGKKARGSGLVKAATQMMGVLEGPNKNRLLDTLGYTQEYERKIDTQWRDLSKINNMDDARTFFEQGLGFERNSAGLYVPAQIRPGMLERHSMPLDNRNKGYRGLQFRSLLRLLEPEFQERLLSGDVQGLQADSIVNPQIASDAWHMAGELMQEMSRGLIGDARVLGGPDSMRSALNPNVPVEWMLSGGQPTGLTNIDMMSGDEDVYGSQFGTRSTDARAQFQIAKTLITGGMDQLLQLPDFLSPQTGVVDHSEGRSQAIQDGLPKEAPLKQLLTANDVNWAKADSPDEEGNKDTLPGLVRRAQSFREGTISPLGRGVNLENPQNLELLWLANRLGGADFNRKEDNFTMPRSLEEVADADSSVIQRMADADNLNVRNLGMYYPRLQHGNYDQNTWSGAMGRGVRREYYPVLNGIRQSIMAGALFNPEMQQQLADKRNELMAYHRGDEEKVQKEMTKFTNQLISLRYQMPLQARAAAWTTGLTDKSEWLDSLGQFAESSVEGLSGNPETLDRLKTLRDESLQAYSDDITDKGYDEIPRVTDDWLEENAGSNPVVNMGFSNYGRDKLPAEFLSNIFDPGVMAGDIQTPFGTKTTPRGIMQRPSVAGKLLFDVGSGQYSEAYQIAE